MKFHRQRAFGNLLMGMPSDIGGFKKATEDAEFLEMVKEILKRREMTYDK